jgi:catechol 2,3-dioxygenase-like lactoylglutathione lyase family enzyme
MRLPLVVALSLWSASPAFAQLATPSEAGLVMGHVHLNVRDIQVQKQLWIDQFGAVPLAKPGLEGVKLPGMLILFDRKESKGGSEGTVLDHFGLKVRNLSETLQRWRVAGYAVQREFKGTEGFPNAYLMGPDAVRIELQEDTSLPQRAIAYHLHFMLADQVTLRDWYVKTFSIASSMRGTHEAADIPGINLSFTAVKRPTAIGSAGRAIDHIGFEVRDLEAYCKRLEARGLKFDVPYHKLAGRDLAVAMLTDPYGVAIELTEGLAGW